MALDDPLDEHEQSERVLEWLRRNGVGLVGGIALGLAAIGGWKWSEAHQAAGEAKAAAQYQSAVEALAANDKQADQKVKSLDGGVYFTLASLELAKAQVAAGKSDAAIATLRAAKPGEPALVQVVNARLARLLIDGKQADAALKLMAGAATPAELEVRGDAQFALGQRDKARESYQQAMAKLDVASPNRRLLELKLIEVGGTLVSPEAKS